MRGRRATGNTALLIFTTRATTGNIINNSKDNDEDDEDDDTEATAAAAAKAGRARNHSATKFVEVVAQNTLRLTRTGALTGHTCLNEG